MVRIRLPLGLPGVGARGGLPLGLPGLSARGGLPLGLPGVSARGGLPLGLPRIMNSRARLPGVISSRDRVTRGLLVGIGRVTRGY